MSYVDKIVKVSKHFYVFPVLFIEDNGKIRKVPAIKGWQDWATQDENKIRSYWGKHHDAKVGAITGKKAGFILLDMDRKNNLDGVATMKQHMKENEKLPKTLGQTTGSGGKHRFYLPNEDKDFEIVGNHSNILKINGERSGIDTRSTGGYVVVWPTEGYSFQGDLGEMSKIPTWLTKKMSKDEKSKKSSKAETKQILVSSGQMRSDMSKLDPTKYKDREAWMKIMMICHSGCNGEDWGKEIFTEWSLRDDDPFNFDPKQYVEDQWSTLDSKKKAGLTYKSMGKEVKLAVFAEGYSEFEDDEDVEEVREGDKDPDDDNTTTVESEKKLSDVWQRTYPAKGVPYLSKNTSNILNFLIQKKLPPELRKLDNPLYNLVAYNELRESVSYTKNPPWMPIGTKKGVYAGRQFVDNDQAELGVFIANNFDIDAPAKFFFDGIELAANRNRYNPVTDYGNALKWDHHSRIDTWLIRCGQAEDTIYTRAVCRKILLASAARALHPGCKVDSALVLEGDQNIGKSGILKIMGKKWFGAPTIPIGTPDAEQNLQGLWWVEWAEYAGGQRAQNDKNKAFLTNESARFRGSYGKKARDWPRRCIICITLNPEGDNRWLNDVTGGRRYWPILLGVRDPAQVDFKWLEANVDQLHAEAFHIIKNTSYHDIATCVPWTMNAEETRQARVIQKERIAVDPIKDVALDLLYGNDFEWNEKEYVQASEVAIALFGELRGTQDFTISRRVGKVLRDGLGWERCSMRVGKTTVTAFRRPHPSEDKNT